MFSKRLSYEQTRWLLLLVGLLILAGIAAIMFARSVDPVEVAATILFLPVFMAFVIFGVRGGLTAGIVAAAAYIALRYPAIQAVGADRFVGLILTRTIGYLTFGAVGGWASDQVSASIQKLELYDHIDDDTGLHNSRFMLETIDLEQSRSRRYEKIFSVVTIEQALGAHGKKHTKLVKAIGSDLEAGVRNVDQVIHVREGDLDIFSVVLPETGGEGARVFASNMTARLDQAADSLGMPAGEWDVSTVTFPDDETAMGELMSRFRSIVMVDFPESPGV